MDRSLQEELFSYIQTWTKKIPLLILGSGASIPFGLPSMSQLGMHLKNSITLTDPLHIEQFERFKYELDQTDNLEEAISKVDLCEKIHNLIIFKTWELIKNKDIEAYYNIINNSLNFPLASFIKYLSRASNQKISILTTNYDRLAEYASCFSHLYTHTGFAQNYHGCFLQKTPRPKQHQALKSDLITFGYTGKVNIWKVHGSVDWFYTDSKDIMHIPINNNIPNNYTPIIITPGKEKYSEAHLEPYRTIIQNADNEITTASSYLCIGYGFNDTHIQEKLIRQIKNQDKPIVVLAKKLTPKTKELIKDSCKNYILIEEGSVINDTTIHSSFFKGEEIIKDKSYWTLEQYLEIIQ